MSFILESPRLSKVILLDSLVTHLHSICWAEKEGINIKAKSSNSNTTVNTTATTNITSTTTTTTTTNSSDSSLTSTSTASENSAADSQIQMAHEFKRTELTNELMIVLMDVVEITRDVTFKTMFQNLSGQTPLSLIEPIISISGTKSHISADISQKLLSLITGQDKEVLLIDWRKNFVIPGEDNHFTTSGSSSFPVEIHTLSVVEAHIVEISKHSTYSILLSLKHTLKSAINLIYYMLANYQHAKEDVRLRTILVPMLFDLRTEYLHDVINKCLEIILDGDSNSDQYQMLAYLNILTHSSKILMEYSDLSSQGRNMAVDEAILHHIIKYWETMLDKPIGLKAMRQFFYDTKQGSLVQILLSFANTSLSQGYSSIVLQFFEKLFQCSEKVDAEFTLDEVCSCISELGQIEPGKLKNWLSHILLGPKGMALIASTNSSNVATPTNMATVSAIPSITDQVAQGSSDTNLDADAMDIDEECSGFAGAAEGGATSAGAWQNITTGTITHRSANDENTTDEAIEKNGRLLQKLTKYVVTENRISSSVSGALFQALIQLGHNLLCPTQEIIDFSDLLQVMVTLADSNSGKGHALLFTATIDWLEISKTQVLEKYLCKPTSPKATIQLENVACILKYMTDLLHGLGSIGSRAICPTWEDENQLEADDLLEELGNVGEDDDSALEDSDEDSLGNKLCTFSITQREFMNQHWYYCHTCKMVDGAGVCSVCVRVCHKNHDVSYAKYGNFFCDCGAKEDGSCKALVRRSANNTDGSILGSSTTETGAVTNSLRRRPSSPRNNPTMSYYSKDANAIMEKGMILAKMIEGSKESLKHNEDWKTVTKCLLTFFNALFPAIKENCAKYSTVGCHLRAKNTLEKLHQPEKTFTFSDQIMVATLGSQEGAFENVRMSYSGEQGQTIRQLLSTNLVRRVALCCLASPHGKRQHLAVSHEKGKVTILQLSTLLKQADASKKKLTLTRLASAPIPCTVLSLAANPANEDYLAVCGLKECHILTFSSTGSTNEHIVLTPQLETGNFIKKAIWLPGSQTKLALVTADFVKIYELAEDSYSPQYYFLVPSGKIRDCTFVYQEDTYYMLIMSSLGYIYTQPLADESLAKHGSFYVTNTLELDHPYIKDMNGQILAGGVSIYYSHVLQMLFFSYQFGRNFMAPLVNVNDGVKCVINLVTNSTSKVFSKGPNQPLCQWTEIPGHPGLVCAMMQNSNNPVIFMIKPNSVTVQEIKALSSKAKIMDMVAIRHSVSGTEKTTLILLCEDGSLRIYSANFENTNFWLSSEVQPIGNIFASGFLSSSKSTRKLNKKSSSHKQITSSISKTNGTSTLSSSGGTSFPIDFFEHCTVMTDIEYGGNDLLQIYNTQQLKNRLNTTGLYVASTRVNGFTLDVINNDSNMVITGVRVLIGTQDIARAPMGVTIHGRIVNTLTTHSRWFDIPMTRDESLQSDKKLSILFGQSHDPEQISILDSIIVYGKTKEVFGWPEEAEEVASAPIASIVGASQAAALQAVSSGSASAGYSMMGTSGTNSNPPATTSTSAGIESESNVVQIITPLDKMVTTMLEVVDSSLAILGGPNADESLKNQAIDIATTLILFPTPSVVQQQARCVLATVHGSKAAYHSYKDKEILKDVHYELSQMLQVKDYKTIDPEAFYRYVLMVRIIAVQRPQSLTKICVENKFPILTSIMQLTKELYKITPSSEIPVSIVKQGLSHPEAVVYSLIEIIYAFALSDFQQINSMCKLLVELLLDPAPVISHSAKQAMIRLLSIKTKRRKVLVNSPPLCVTPTSTQIQQQPSTSTAGPSTSSASLNRNPSNNNDMNAFRAAGNVQEVDAIEPFGLEAAGGGAAAGNQTIASLEALLGFPPMLDLHADADDEAIMEIAIALSLQETERDLQTLGVRGRSLQSLAAAVGAGNFNNEAAASTGGSDDDEGSTAATDGSTLRTSPAEPVGSGGSESGGSGVESIGGTSYDDQLSNQTTSRNNEMPPLVAMDETQQGDSDDISNELENATKLHNLRFDHLQIFLFNKHTNVYVLFSIIDVLFWINWSTISLVWIMQMGHRQFHLCR